MASALVPDYPPCALRRGAGIWLVRFWGSWRVVMRQTVGVLLVFCGAALSQEPPPADAKAEAQRHVDRAEALFREEKVAAAREEFEKALELLGGVGDEVDVLRVNLRIAECHAAGSECAKALEIWRRCGDHVEVTTSIQNVGSALLSRGLLADAIPLFRESLAIRRRLGEGGTIEVAETLNAIAYCLEHVDRAEEALPLFRESLAMKRALYQGDHPDVAAALNNLGHCLCSAGKAPEGLPVHLEAVEMARRLSKGDDPDVAMCLNNLGLCYGSLERYQEALLSCDEALAMRRRLFQGDHASLARSMSNVGHFLRCLDRSHAALPLFQGSLEMRRRLFLRDHVDVAQGIHNLACCLDTLGRSTEALGLHEESLAMYRRLWGGDHSDVALGILSVAECLGDQGRSTEALGFHEESLAMYRRLFKADHPSVAKEIGAVAECLQALGRLAEALPLFESSLEMYRRLSPGDHSGVAKTLCNQAFCLKEIGRPAEALPLYEESLAMYRRLCPGDNTGTATAINNVAMCLSSLDRHADAVPLNEEALAMRRRLFEGDHRDVAVSLNNAALFMDYVGRASEALPLYEEALAMRRRLFGGDHPDVAEGLHNLGSSMCDLGRSTEGVLLLQESVAMSRRLGSPDKHLWLSTLGRCLLRVGRSVEGVEALQEAVDQIESLRGGAASGLTEGDRVAYFGKLKEFHAYERMIRALTALGRDAEALSYVERARARSLLDTLEQGRADPLGEVRRRAEERKDDALLERIDKSQSSLEAAGAEVARLTHALASMGPTGKDTPERREEARKLTVDLAAARRAQQDALRQRAQLIRGEFAVARPADAAALQRLAGADGRVLEYAVSEEDATLFAVPPEGSAIRAFRLAWRDGTAVTSESLAEKVEAYGARMRAGGGEARGWFEEETGAGGGVSGSDLFEALVPAEVREDVLKAKVVYVVADGALNRLPFETLVVAPGTFWMEGGPPLVYGASGSALLWSRERRDKQLSEGRLDGAVVVGDPVFRPAIEPPATGILVTGVAPEGQASRLGMQAGDVILAYDEKETADIKVLTEARAAAEAAVKEGSRKAGEIPLVVWRAGERKEVSVQAGPLGVMIAPGAPPEAWRRFQLGDPALARAAVERTADLSRYGELKPLPGTRREAEAIAEALKEMRVKLLLGEAATHPAVLAAAPLARYLHFATHGLADETEMASYSSLALTLPAVPTAEDDGFLSLEDLFSRWRGKLQGCELVVLSACETQKGRIQKDEAVQALPVGFLFAGAPTVIATLWRVDDASAAELMGDFYRRLAAGKGKLEAFTEARKALRKRHPDPHHWAPFVYIGDPR